MIGITLAAVFGGLQFYLLTVVTRSVARGKISVLAMVGQFFCPIAGLLLCAFLAKQQLLHCAIGITVILIGGALALLIRSWSRSRYSQEKRD